MPFGERVVVRRVVWGVALASVPAGCPYRRVLWMFHWRVFGFCTIEIWREAPTSHGNVAFPSLSWHSPEPHTL